MSSFEDEISNDLNYYYEVSLFGLAEEKTEMFFGEMAPPPNRGVACLNFRYKKFQTGELLQVLRSYTCHQEPCVKLLCSAYNTSIEL